jgi:hypothetical protein
MRTTDRWATDRWTTEGHIANLVDKLNGKGVEGIRDFFVANGIKGMRMRACKCPVANYLRNETGVSIVSVGTRFIHAPDVVGIPVDILTPTNVGNFIFQFDQGAFPELDVEELS